LRHEKCNLGPLQDEIRLEFDTGAKVFRQFGHVPGAAAARSMMRNTQRVAVLRLLAATPGRLSMSATANNNAWKVLRDAQGFPAQLDRAGFFSLLVGLQRDGLVTEREYLNEHRRKHKCLELTELGRMRAAQGSSAPSSWRDSDE
jgi:hypothetical protein